MNRHRHMQSKYFLRQFFQHLFIITLPIFLLGSLLTAVVQKQLKTELAVYAERSKAKILYNITNVLNSFQEETALFSTTPSLAFSISKLLNQESLDYRDIIYKSLISTLISTTSNISSYVDCVYLYYDNPYGKYFSSFKQYTGIDAPGNTDKEWLKLYHAMPSGLNQWLTPRMVRYYEFEEEEETVSLFRRFDYLHGVMVLNFNKKHVSSMLAAGHIYPGSCTMITDREGRVLFGSPGYESLLEKADRSEFALPETKEHETYAAVDVKGVSYIYYTSPVPDYDLEMISLLPSKEVFRPVNTLILAFFILILFGISLSFSLSWSITVSNFQQLHHLLELFHQSEQQESPAIQFRADARNEYDLIFNNIVRTFLSNHKLQLNLAQEEVRRKDAQLAALQLQLNPHFIFNTLQTIDLEILRAGAPGSPSRLIHSLSDILKYSLENTSRSVRIRDEIEICKTYAEIQKLRYTNPFILYWDYEDDILGLPIIHLVLQPLLENSLHHGIKEGSRKGLVKIKILEREGRIHVILLDNGVGISKERLQEIRRNLRIHEWGQTSHIGIYNTNLRLILTYGLDAGISIHSKEGWGTMVRFSFPMSNCGISAIIRGRNGYDKEENIEKVI